MEEDFSRDLNKAINSLGKQSIDLSKNKPLYYTLMRILVGTDAGTYLRGLFSDSERSYSDKGIEEIDLDRSDIDLLIKIPLDTELYIDDTWTDNVDGRDRSMDSLNGPGYKTYYKSNDAYFSIIFNSISQSKDNNNYSVNYTYEVSRRVENDDWN